MFIYIWKLEKIEKKVMFIYLLKINSFECWPSHNELQNCWNVNFIICYVTDSIAARK